MPQSGAFRVHTRRCALRILALIALAWPAAAAPSYTVWFNDPGNTFSSFYSNITSEILAAGADWDKYIGGSNAASIDIQVQFSPSIPTADGTSATSVPLGDFNGRHVFQQGAASEVLTGLDPNGSATDATIRIGTGYLTNELWFDPNAFARTAPVPSNKIDAESAFIHEMGHILGLNGFLDGTTGQPLSDDNISTYDRFVTFDGTNLFFTGPEAEAVYKGPVPLTFGNYAHVGNNPPRPGADLLPDLMNGVHFLEGHRYDISPLDVTMLADVGLPTNSSVAAPEPSSVATLGLAVVALVLMARTRSWIDLKNARLNRSPTSPECGTSQCREVVQR